MKDKYQAGDLVYCYVTPNGAKEKCTIIGKYDEKTERSVPLYFVKTSRIAGNLPLRAEEIERHGLDARYLGTSCRVFCEAEIEPFIMKDRKFQVGDKVLCHITPNNWLSDLPTSRQEVFTVIGVHNDDNNYYILQVQEPYPRWTLTPSDIKYHHLDPKYLGATVRHINRVSLELAGCACYNCENVFKYLPGRTDLTCWACQL